MRVLVNPERLTRDVIVIGGSAGAYTSIQQILAALPPELEAFVGVVLHRGAQSDLDWSGSFRRKSGFDVRQPAHDEELRRGRAYLAPNDRHLTFSGGRACLDSDPKQHYTRPAVDVLFKSAALEYGDRVVGVVLSGGGHDGMAGLLSIGGHNGLGLVQRPSEAEYPSMPKYAIAHDHVQAALDIDQFGEVLIALSEGESITVESGATEPWCADHR